MPPGPVAETTAELILRGRFAGIPVKVRGSLVDGKLGELSGSVTIQESLEQFLVDLGSRFDSESLRALTGDNIRSIALDSLAFETANLSLRLPSRYRLVAAGAGLYS